MIKKPSIVIGSAINGYIVSNNKNPQPVDSNDLMVFDELEKLLEYITKTYADNKEIKQ